MDFNALLTSFSKLLTAPESEEDPKLSRNQKVNTKKNTNKTEHAKEHSSNARV